MPGHKDRLRLLRSLRLLDSAAEKDLSALEEFLKPASFDREEVIFEEGGRGQSLYFIAEGRVRISKRTARGREADLSLLGPGDCFGEMAVIDEAPRSATARALEDCLIFELRREDLKRWLKSRPDLAMGFFSKLVLVQSQRLRRTSGDLALVLDLSQLILDRNLSPKDLLIQAVNRVLPHLEGSWSADAYFYDPFNRELERVVSSEPDNPVLPQYDPENAASGAAEPCRWLSPKRCLVWLPGSGKPQGCLLFRAAAAPETQERSEIGRVLAAAARLLSAAMENAGFRLEELLRARLKSAHDPNL